MASKQEKPPQKDNQNNKNPQNIVQTNISGRPLTQAPSKLKQPRSRIFKDDSQSSNRFKKSISPSVIINNNPVSPPSKLYNTSFTNTAITGNSNTITSRSNVRISYQSPAKSGLVGHPSAYHVHYQQQLLPPMQVQIPVLNKQINPQRIVLVKNAQMLEYQNKVLIQQLQERDDIILMFKKGWTPNNLPINDEVIKDLNLKICQKNTLVEQIHRILIQFQQTIEKQKIEISPICKQRLNMIKDLINQHEHRPVIIRQRIVQTGNIVPNMAIQTSETHLQIEIKTLRQKLQYFERQNKVLETTISGLKTQRPTSNIDQKLSGSKAEIQKLNNQILLLEQQISNYKQQMFQLCKQIQQNNGSEIHKLQDDKGQVQRLKKEIKDLNETISKLSLKDNEIMMLKQHIQRYKKENTGLIQKQVQYKNQINQLLTQINELKSRPVSSTNGQSRIRLQIDELNKNHNLKVSDLQRQLQNSQLKVKQLQEKVNLVNIDAQNWKKHLETAQIYIQQLLKQIQKFKTELSHSKMSTNDQSTKLNIENSKMTQQIASLNITIKQLKAQKQKWVQQQKRQQASIQQYTQQINQLNLQIHNIEINNTTETKNMQLNIRNEFESNTRNLNLQMEKYKTQIASLKKQMQKLNANSVNMKSQESWKLEIQNIRNTYEAKIKQLQSNTKQLQSKIKELQPNTRQLQSNTKQLQSKIKQLQSNAKQLQTKLRKQSQSTISSLKLEIENYKNQIAQLRRQIDNYKLQLSSIGNQSQTIQQLKAQLQVTRTQGQAKGKDLWQKLNFAQLYILKLTASMQQLEKANAQLQEKVSSKKDGVDQYMYKYDQKYQIILNKLKQISGKNHSAISAQSQFWQSYKLKRKQDIEQIERLVNQCLSVMTNIDQAIIVKRSELYRLDLLKLETLINDINNIKQNKSQLQSALRQKIETKFYGLLKSVATPITQ